MGTRARGVAVSASGGPRHLVRSAQRQRQQEAEGLGAYLAHADLAGAAGRGAAKGRHVFEVHCTLDPRRELDAQRRLDLELLRKHLGLVFGV